MGKGSKPRPIKNKEAYDQNWDNIFGTKEPQDFQKGYKETPKVKPVTNGKFNYY